jgi:putative nucleotidyltransferase with HDIG domain
MPGMSGIDVLSQVVADHPDTCVIMITAVADAQTAVEAMKLGAYDYVTKPFDLEALGMRVEKALERRRLILENREYQENLEKQVEHQVGQIQQYYRESIQALAREEIALEVLDAARKGDKPKASDRKKAAEARESAKPVKEFVRKLSPPPGPDQKSEFERALQTARLLALMAEIREPYARGHSERVNMVANEIAVQLGCSEELINDLKLAALVHDIGKVVIQDQILFKPSSLTPAEHNEVKRHPVASVEILRSVDFFSRVIPLVESHHEWYNGKGYPNRRRGEDIPLGARILAVADAYDAMTCPRPYRPSRSNEEAVELLKKGAGKQWDPAVVDAFIKILDRETKMLEDPVTDS